MTMFAIIGAAGKVGYATAAALREAGMPVRAILRDEAKAGRLTEIGCEIALADLQDGETLAKAIGNADVVQVILPPSPQDKDTAGQMRAAIESLALALEKASPTRILAISDYGAHMSQDIGIPSMYRAFEERLGRLNCNKLFLRSAEHMQGWGRVVGVAKSSNTLPSVHVPVDMLYPTISAPDLGLIAAELLLRPAAGSLEIVHAEGPRRYTANDAAKAIGELLGQKIDAVPIPRSQWKGIFEQAVSPSLTDLLIKTNDAQNDGLVDVEPDGEVRYGTTQLIDALRPLVLTE